MRPPHSDPHTLFALTGALALSQSVEHTMHLVAPGPGVPYVVPRLLATPNSIAVLSSTAVGSHTAYVTTYYVPPQDVSTNLPVANEWPYASWRGPSGWREIFAEEEFATDLTSNEFDGRILWIEPGDSSALLRSDISSSPYIDVEGSSRPQRIQGGKTW